jgi:hypothetical protein
MATYEELYSLRNDSALKNKVTVACIVAAETVMNELVSVDNHANRLLWAKAVFANPKGEADRMFSAILAANSASDVAVIQAATDAAIQTNVDDHIDLFADGS